MCWCYWKIKNSNGKMLKIYNEGKESAREFINSIKKDKNIIAINTDSIVFSNSLLNNRYIFKINSNRIYDTKKDIFLNTKQITEKLNRLEYYKGICFD